MQSILKYLRDIARSKTPPEERLREKKLRGGVCARYLSEKNRIKKILLILLAQWDVRPIKFRFANSPQPRFNMASLFHRGSKKINTTNRKSQHSNSVKIQSYKALDTRTIKAIGPVISLLDFGPCDFLVADFIF